MSYPRGVPSPIITHVHPYPTRFHGGIWTRPEFGLPYVRTPYAVFRPSQMSGLGVDFDTGDGVFRRPDVDGGGVFNEISGLGATPTATQFLGAAAVAGLIVYLVARKKKMQQNPTDADARLVRTAAKAAAARGERDVVCAFDEDFYSGKLGGLGFASDAAFRMYKPAFDAEKKRRSKRRKR